MGVTSIEWTSTVNPDGSVSPGYSFNPWIGCTKVAQGCTNCYAEKNVAVTMGVGRGSWGPSGTRYVTSDANWKKPLAWAKKARRLREACRSGGECHRGLCATCPTPPPRPRVFCASLADVFEDLPELAEPRARLFLLIGSTPELDWLLLTKRPENVERLMRQAQEEVADEIGEPYSAIPSPMKNIWLGTSIANQEDADRNIPELLKVPAAVRFVSYEPAVGPVDLSSWLVDLPEDEDGAPYPGNGLDWLIVGGESGPKARPCDVAWIRSAVEQCKAAQVPVFVKQLGSYPSDALGCRFALGDKKGGDPSEWDESIRVREFPEVKA